MAAEFTVSFKCTVCNTAGSFTDTGELAKGSINTKEVRYQCAKCGIPIPISITSIAVTHSGDVGANDTVTHTMATPGTIASAVS